MQVLPLLFGVCRLPDAPVLPLLVHMTSASRPTSQISLLLTSAVVVGGGVCRAVAVFLQRFSIPTDFTALLDEWATRFFEELDYVHEVRPLQTCPAHGESGWTVHT